MQENQKIALYLDDVRTPIEEIPDHQWVIVRNYDQFRLYVTAYYMNNKRLPDLISFDHDLAEEHYSIKEDNSIVTNYNEMKEKTGMHCAKWLTTLCDVNGLDLRLTKLAVHSFNPVGAQNIQLWINSFLKKSYGAEHATCFMKQWKSKMETQIEENDSKD